MQQIDVKAAPTIEAVVEPTVLELAWAAGLFEGEGSITIQGSTSDARLAMTDLDVVTRFASIVGWGEPRVKKTPHGKKQQYVVGARGDTMLGTMALLEPFFGERRRAKLNAVRAERTRKLTGVCATCGKQFVAYRLLRGKKQFCSEGCYESFYSRSRPLYVKGQMSL